ncbi:hypothetical protein [Pseudoalteromonas byunsanensis]|uniref:Uncharacterized protein n=1 Tax=Pseudoalteromonas byunsanensis TaxID=327939 RepID=A0A1S1N1P4_9GAMM|nr:hypothetical protein [Pseudoalteromonas byunsanensis]OHU94984.1 hypothetical protein BIW53_13285 [Pseudoalteromonas byunsanensis]
MFIQHSLLTKFILGAQLLNIVFIVLFWLLPIADVAYRPKETLILIIVLVLDILSLLGLFNRRLWSLKLIAGMSLARVLSISGATFSIELPSGIIMGASLEVSGYTLGINVWGLLLVGCAIVAYKQLAVSSAPAVKCSRFKT